MNNPPTISRRNKVLRWMALVGWILIVLAHLVFFLIDLDSDFSNTLVPCAGELGFSGKCNFLAISSAEMETLAI